MELNFSFDRPEDSPGFMLWRLTTEWQRLQRQALKAIGLTHPQFVVLACTLWVTSQSKKIATQKIVSEMTSIDKMTLSDLVNTLITKKLLARSEHPQDKRSYSLRLTKRGKDVTLKAVPIVEGIDKNFFSRENNRLSGFTQLINDV